MTDVDWYPPPTYFTTGNYGPPAPETILTVPPISPSVQVKADGTRFLRYQLPQVPIEIGSLAVAGFLRSTVDGELRHIQTDALCGTVDFDNGIFEVYVDYDQAPGLGSRTVQYVFPRRTLP